jgi:hypothetical protein
MALAAAKQGKFAAFHKAMYAAGRPNAQTIASAAQAAGIDMAAAQRSLPTRHTGRNRPIWRWPATLALAVRPAGLRMARSLAGRSAMTLWPRRSKNRAKG